MLVRGWMVSVSLISSSSSESISELEDPSSSSSSMIGERRWGWGNGATGMNMASSSSLWSSSGREPGRVFLKVTSTTEDERNCVSLLICTRESKGGAVSKRRNRLGMSIGLDRDCRVSLLVSSPASQSESESSSRANELTKLKSNESHESEELAREGMSVGWQGKSVRLSVPR
jgi:hypothetical protein